MASSLSILSRGIITTNKSLIERSLLLSSSSTFTVIPPTIPLFPSLYNNFSNYSTLSSTSSAISSYNIRSFSTKPNPTPKATPATANKSVSTPATSASSNETTTTNVDPLSSLPLSSVPSRPATLVIDLKVKSFHHVYLNQFVIALNKRVENLGLPTPSTAFLPKKTQRWTVLRSPHVDKKARDQFERVTHKRSITIRLPYIPSNIELAYRLLRSVSNISANVDIRAKYMVSQGTHIIR